MMSNVGYPACFNSMQQYTGWQHYARVTKDTRLDGYCADCTPEYQREMKKATRCRFPDTTFGLDQDGMVAGQRSVEAKRAIQRVADRT